MCKIQDYNDVELLSATYSQEGHLRRWGSLRIEDIVLCQRFQTRNTLHQPLTTTFRSLMTDSCTLNLENILDLANTSGNDNYIALYINFTQKGRRRRSFLQSIPILIRNLTNANNVSHKFLMQDLDSIRQITWQCSVSL